MLVMHAVVALGVSVAMLLITQLGHFGFQANRVLVTILPDANGVTLFSASRFAR
jgi:hypothetical protein